ncbi:MAG: PAS domain-containing protein [Candidatus Marsarchaeota archaeon]|nr:PAS domain-containing protein [Candidatus Marsarchaeota archaeon]
MSDDRWFRSPYATYPLALFSVAVVTALLAWAQATAAVLNLSLFYLVLVLFIALLLGTGPAIAATGASVLAVYLFFISPVRTLSIGSAQEGILLILIAVTSFLTIFLVSEERRQRERAQAAAAGERSAREELEALQAISEAGLTTLDPDELLNSLLKRLVQVTKADGGSILLLDDSHEHLETKAAYGKVTGMREGERVEVGKGFAGRIALEQKPASLANPSASSAGPDGSESGVAGSLLGVPLKLHGEIIGVAQIATVKARQFTPREVRVLELMADRAVATVERARLFEVSEKNLRLAESVIENSPAAIAVVNGPDHRIVVANRVCHEMFGARDSLVGRTPEEALPGRSAALSERLERAYAGGNGVSAAGTVQIKTGTLTSYWNLSCLPLARQPGRPESMLLIATNVTDQAEALRQVAGLARQAREKARQVGAILDNIADPIFVIDKDRTLVDMNKAAREIVGIRSKWDMRAHQNRYLRLLNVRYPDGSVMPSPDTQLDGIVEGQGSSDLELLIRPAGAAEDRIISMSSAPVRDRAGNLQYLVNVGHDITDLVQTRRQLQESATQARQAAELYQAANEELVQTNLHLQAVIDSLPEGIIIVDSLGKFSAGNKKAGEILGLAGEPADAAAFELVSAVSNAGGEMLPPTDNPIVRALRTGEAYIGEEMRIRRPSGEEVTILVNTSPLKDAEGKTSGAISVFQDISKMKELDQLKDEFMAIASHELKTPLTSIKGYTQLVLKRAAQVPEDRRGDTRLLRIIDGQIDKMAALVNELLDISRIQTGRFVLNGSRGEIGEIIGRSIAAIQSTAVNHEIVYRGPGRLVYGDWDGERVEELVLNLLANAVKYSPDGGRVEVRATFGCERVEVAVQDWGMGIPEESQARVFDRFFTGANSSVRSFGGLGIGLCIARQIVELHGGEIRLESKLGEGSTFTFSLPARIE